jgi:hypothetical protein
LGKFLMWIGKRGELPPGYDWMNAHSRTRAYDPGQLNCSSDVERSTDPGTGGGWCESSEMFAKANVMFWLWDWWNSISPADRHARSSNSSYIYIYIYIYIYRYRYIYIYIYINIRRRLPACDAHLCFRTSRASLLQNIVMPAWSYIIYTDHDRYKWCWTKQASLYSAKWSFWRS